MPGTMIQEVSVDVAAVLIPTSAIEPNDMMDPSPESVSHEQFQPIQNQTVYRSRSIHVSTSIQQLLYR